MKAQTARKEETESESSTEEDNGDPHHVSFTKASPLGRILLGLVADNLALQEKAGIRESNVSARALCTAFYSQMEEERKLLKANVENTAAITEERIVSREFESLSVSQEDYLPEYFSARDKLVNNSLQLEACRLFPTKQKFSGSDALGLIEFYHNLKMAQEQMRLSEK